MRAAALDERAPLAHAEAVLLVDDGDGEIVEVDLLLDQGVRPDDDVRVAGRDQLPRGRVLARADRAREQRDAHAERLAELVDREEVLLGEGFRGRHQRPLASRLDRAQQRVERDDRLPGADVALEEALHRGRPAEVAVDLADRPLLVRGERERQRRAVALEQLARRGERLRGGLLAECCRPRERDLENKELVERQPEPSPLGLGQRAWAVQRDERVGAQRELLALTERRRQRLARVADERERLRAERRAAVFWATSSPAG